MPANIHLQTGAVICVTVAIAILSICIKNLYLKNEMLMTKRNKIIYIIELIDISNNAINLDRTTNGTQIFKYQIQWQFKKIDIFYKMFRKQKSYGKQNSLSPSNLEGELNKFLDYFLIFLYLIIAIDFLYNSRSMCKIVSKVLKFICIFLCNSQLQCSFSNIGQFL